MNRQKAIEEFYQLNRPKSYFDFLVLKNHFEGQGYVCIDTPAKMRQHIQRLEDDAVIKIPIPNPFDNGVVYFIQAQEEQRQQHEENKQVIPAKSVEKRLKAVPGLDASLVFEPKAVYDEGEKRLYAFDKSLERLRSRRYARHPLPQEEFGLLIANIEGKLTSEQKSVAEDMINNHGEWFSLAMLRMEDDLWLYYHPELLGWNNVLKTYKWETQKYQRQYSNSSRFTIKKLPSSEVKLNLKDLNTLCPELIEELWTRPFEELPSEIKREGSIYLPPEGKIWPAGRGSFDYRFSIDSYSCEGRASRGIRRARKK